MAHLKFPKRRKQCATIALVLLLSLTAAGCGSSSRSTTSRASSALTSAQRDFVAWAHAFVGLKNLESAAIAASERFNRAKSRGDLAAASRAADLAAAAWAALRRKVGQSFPRPPTQPARDLDRTYRRAIYLLVDGYRRDRSGIQTGGNRRRSSFREGRDRGHACRSFASGTRPGAGHGVLAIWWGRGVRHAVARGDRRQGKVTRAVLRRRRPARSRCPGAVGPMQVSGVAHSRTRNSRIPRAWVQMPCERFRPNAAVRVERRLAPSWDEDQRRAGRRRD
jgi:hypothetical protein